MLGVGRKWSSVLPKLHTCHHSLFPFRNPCISLISDSSQSDKLQMQLPEHQYDPCGITEEKPLRFSARAYWKHWQADHPVFNIICEPGRHKSDLFHLPSNVKSWWQVFSNEEAPEHLRTSLLTGKAWQQLPKQHYPRKDVSEITVLFKQRENWLECFPLMLLNKLLPNSGWNVVASRRHWVERRRRGFVWITLIRKRQN